MKVVAVFSLILLLAACVTVGTRMDASLTDQLTVGTSTRADAIALFGKPGTVTDSTTGSVLIWHYTHATAFSGAKSSMVVLTFNKEGILTDKTQSNTETH